MRPVWLYESFMVLMCINYLSILQHGGSKVPLGSQYISQTLKCIAHEHHGLHNIPLINVNLFILPQNLHEFTCFCGWKIIPFISVDFWCENWSKAANRTSFMCCTKIKVKCSEWDYSVHILLSAISFFWLLSWTSLPRNEMQYTKNELCIICGKCIMLQPWLIWLWWRYFLANLLVQDNTVLGICSVLDAWINLNFHTIQEIDCITSRHSPNSPCEDDGTGWIVYWSYFEYNIALCHIVSMFTKTVSKFMRTRTDKEVLDFVSCQDLTDASHVSLKCAFFQLPAKPRFRTLFYLTKHRLQKQHNDFSLIH